MTEKDREAEALSAELEGAEVTELGDEDLEDVAGGLGDKNCGCGGSDKNCGCDPIAE
jgi:hypothetical protein